MFVERYLELSNELKYRKGESGAFMQLGELLTQKGEFETSTKHFYRAMKIAEDTEDSEIKDTAKVNFGMANASMKWQDHVGDILRGIEGHEKIAAAEEDRDEVPEAGSDDEDDNNWICESIATAYICINHIFKFVRALNYQYVKINRIS